LSRERQRLSGTLLSEFEPPGFLANAWLFLHILHISWFAEKSQRPARLTDSTWQALLFSTDYVLLLGQVFPGLLSFLAASHWWHRRLACAAQAKAYGYITLNLPQ
jgi:hypothetical protein